MTQTRTLLLDLGEKAVRTRGYAGFSYADLARDAGIRKASIHHHFPTKADLALALIERFAAMLADALTAIEASAPTGGRALGGAIDLYRDALGDGDTMCMCAALSADAALLEPRTTDALNAANKAIALWFERVLSKGKEDGSIAGVDEPETSALAALAQLQGAQLLARASGSIEVFDRAVATLRVRITS
ncbi:TetR/AcrR family transcriptional regulator [Erythrobacter sp.]|uniref:TetR/AcrR family transcriptional regulator n=1 Tax=Erythrobacter sp. TaxID=1042 RepID=UPI00311DD4C1